MKKMKKSTRARVTVSSGNVFADLGLSNPQERLAKAELAAAIHSKIKQRGLTQGKAARILGIGQPRISALVTGRMELFSTDALLQYLTALGSDVSISIGKSRGKQKGKVTVLHAWR